VRKPEGGGVKTRISRAGQKGKREILMMSTEGGFFRYREKGGKRRAKKLKKGRWGGVWAEAGGIRDSQEKLFAREAVEKKLATRKSP